MQELIAKIEQWAEDRNLINGSTPLDQAMKLFSEFGELADAVAKDDLDGTKDGIGDVFVVLTIMAKQTESSISDVINSNYTYNWGNNQKQMMLDLIERIYDLSFDFVHQNTSFDSMECALSILDNISAINNLTLQQCVQHAYNDIKDRKGIMHNGVFIKESDPRYAELVK